MDFINTGVPHTVVQVRNLSAHPVVEQGRAVRHHPRFAPAGTNADFISVSGPGLIELRTYERGVEDETLACGTGAIASALVAAARGMVESPVTVKTTGGDLLKIHFQRAGESFRQVWLEGPTAIACEGRLHEEACKRGSRKEVKMFGGSIVAIVTPFRNGKVDEDAYRELIEFQIQNGTSAIVPCGTTGESATLSMEEHGRVIEIAVAAAKKRVPVIAGAGGNSTREAIELSGHAKKCGADATLQVVPYYNKPTQEGIYQHFRAIAKAVPLPQVVYNIPGRTGVNMLPQTVARVAELPEVVAIKEASGDLGQMAEVVRLAGDKITLLSGDDNLTLPVLAIGGKGVISVVANIVPEGLGRHGRRMGEGGRGQAPGSCSTSCFPSARPCFTRPTPFP